MAPEPQIPQRMTRALDEEILSEFGGGHEEEGEDEVDEGAARRDGELEAAMQKPYPVAKRTPW